MKFFFVFSLGFALGLSSFAETPEEIRNAIRNQISQRHPEPSANFWSKLGPDALPVIKQMYGETENPVDRTWLIDGMGYFNDPSVATFLESEINETSNNLLKKKMLISLTHSMGDQAFDFVEPYLNDKDPHIRLEVAQSMRRYMESTRAKTRVDAFVHGEKVAWVKTEAAKEIVPDTKLKKEGSVFQHKEPEKNFNPLPEKSWAGEWKGVYLHDGKNGPANLMLTMVNEKASPAEQKWKIELKLPKQSKIEIKGKEIEIVYYQTAHSHWLEVRDRKQDAVFIGKRD